jgi:hypothetical protein
LKNKISKVVSGSLILFSGILTNWISSNPKSLYLPAFAFCIWGSWMILAGVHTYVSKQEEEKAAEKTSVQSVPANALLNEDGRVLTTEANPAPAKPESKPTVVPDNTNAPTATPPKTEPAKTAPTSGASSSLLPSQIIAMHAVDPFSFTSTGSGGIKSTMQYANEGDIVGWTLYLLDATSFWSPFGDSNLKIRCTEQPMDTTAVVVFNVPLFAHEYLRVSIDRYQMFSVVGTIAHIGSNEILLKDAIMEPVTDGL